MTRALSAPHLICTGIMMEMVMKNTARKTGIIPAFSERTPDTFETPCTSRDTRYNAQARTNDTTVPATQNRYFSRIYSFRSIGSVNRNGSPLSASSQESVPISRTIIRNGK